jgi:methionine aminotransferase
VYTPPPVTRLPRVGTTIFTVMSQLATELGAVNTGQGFPDFEPPQRLCDLVAQHLRSGHNQYAPMAGIPLLRQAIAAKVARHYGRDACPDTEVTVTCGGTEALASSIQALVHPGDEVIMFDPAYDSYEPIVELCGGIARRIPLSRPDFAIDWQRFAEALSPRTRLVIVNFPHNPSGACLSMADLDQLAAALRGTAAYVLADEVYEHMVFDGARHVSLNAHPELAARSIVASSFGKTYHATGWKIGYCVAPAALTAELRKVHQFVTFAIATPLQYAIADFMAEHPEWEDGLSLFYEAKRDRLRALLTPSRFVLAPAPATYFQLVDYSAISDLPDAEFSLQLIRSIGVATIPVSPFCERPLPGERLVRLCFAKQDATLVAAAERLARL